MAEVPARELGVIANGRRARRTSDLRLASSVSHWVGSRHVLTVDQGEGKICIKEREEKVFTCGWEAGLKSGRGCQMESRKSGNRCVGLAGDDPGQIFLGNLPKGKFLSRALGPRNAGC